jgi:hypothetical protein
MGSQGRRDGRRRHVAVGRNGLSITDALVVRPSTVDLEVRIGMLPAEDAGGLRETSLELGGILLPLPLLLGEVCLRVVRRQVGLAFLQMLNLARRVLCAHVAAVQTSYFITLPARDQYVASEGGRDND